MTSWLNNNFKLLALTLLAVLSVNVVWGGDVNLTINATSVTSNGVTVTCANTSGTAPADQGDYIRLYANNTVTISSNSKNIVAMTIGWSKNPNKTYASASANCGEYNDPSSSGSTVVYGNWSGSSKTIVFTIASSGQKQIHSVEVTFEAAGPSCTTPPTVSSSLSGISSTTSSITATVGITSIGGCDITENGLVYSTTNPTPTVGGTGCSKETVTACGSTAANKTVTISGLACGQSYYVRGYATNAAGTQYSNVPQISTSACLVDHFIDNIQETTGYTGDGKAVSTSFEKSSITLLDKAAATSGSCEEVHYHFVGWVTAADRSAGNVDAEHIVNFQDSGNVPTGTTYYAVWAKEDEEQ